MNTFEILQVLTHKLREGTDASSPIEYQKLELLLNALLEVITESLIVNRKFHLHKFGAFFLLLSNAPFHVKKQVVFEPSPVLLRYLSSCQLDDADA